MLNVDYRNRLLNPNPHNMVLQMHQPGISQSMFSAIHGFNPNSAGIQNFARVLGSGSQLKSKI